MKLLIFTDSVKEPQDAVSILVQTTLKLVFLKIYHVLMTILADIFENLQYMMAQVDLPVAGERIVRQLATRLSVLVQRITLSVLWQSLTWSYLFICRATHLSHVAHSPLRTSADQIPAAPTHTVS